MAESPSQPLSVRSDAWHLLRAAFRRIGLGRARALQPFATLAISIAAGLFLARTFDLGSALRTAGSVPPLVLLAAALALASGLLLSSLRYHRVLDALGLKIPLQLAVRANLIGIVGGLLFFQLLGQTLARAAVLSRSGISGSAVLLANMYERISAFFSLSVMAAVAGLYLYGTISIDLLGGGVGLVKLVVALILVASAAYLAVRRKLLKSALGSLLAGTAVQALAGVGVYSILMHLSTLVAFIAVGKAMAPQVDILSLVAASLIVMFAASLPISFAGWGVREISAVYAYGTIGIGPDEALAISILVGALGLGLAIAFGWVSDLVRTSAPTISIPAPNLIAVRRSFQIERSLTWFIPAGAAVLVFFQVHLPVSGGTINVNLADPFAIAGGLIFLVRYLAMEQRKAAWRVEYFEPVLIVMTVGLALALLNGWARFGYSDWAFVNRFIGWFVLLGYVGTGALIVTASLASGLRLLLKCMLAAGVAIALLDLTLLAAVQFGAPRHEWLPLMRIAGMAQNANAFALQLTILIGVFCALGGRSRPRRADGFSSLAAFVLAILMLALFCSSSRTGLLAGAAVLAAACALRWLSLRLLVTAAVAALAMGLAPKLLLMMGDIVLNTLHGLGLIDFPRAAERVSSSAWALLRIEQDYSVQERWYTITRGMELWVESPILGNGLGAFVETVRAEKGIFLVIHNTSIWVLAEFGIVGLALLSGGFAQLVKVSWLPAREGRLWARVLILVLLCFALFQMTHDVFYQRIFWFLFGATLFTGYRQGPRTGQA